MREQLQESLQETLQTALGRDHRDDPVRGRTGGPASNARLAAATGLLLLLLALGELITLISIGRLIEWHLALGAALVAPTALKVAVTGWRMLRYYTRDRAYVRAGPPPLLLRLLGPVVVAGTVLVLTTGLWLVYLGPDSARESLLLGISPLSLHQASFALWVTATGLHLLGRFVPALQLTVLRTARAAGAATVRGAALRQVVLVATVLLSAASAALVLQHTGGWTGIQLGDLGGE